MSAHEFLQAGDFNVRFTLEALQLSDDGCGGSIEAWIERYPVWGKLIPIKGIVVSAADSEHQELTHWIYVRHNEDIRSGMRFVSGLRKFMISVVSDPDESKRYTLCEVIETQ